MKSYPVFTIANGVVTEGAKVGSLEIKSANTSVPALKIGSRSRITNQGVITIKLLPENYRKWKKGEEVVIKSVQLGQTKSGKPKLIETRDANSTDAFVGLFDTECLYRGSCTHTGDRINYENVEEGFQEFPGEILVKGANAASGAGALGVSSKIIAQVPTETVFRTAYSGRDRGAARAHYYSFDGNSITALTWEEREAIEVF